MDDRPAAKVITEQIKTQVASCLSAKKKALIELRSEPSLQLSFLAIKIYTPKVSNFWGAYQMPSGYFYELN